MSAVRSRRRSRLTPRLGAGQRRAGAGVDAAAEGHVLAGVAAVDVERRRVVEAAWVAVGGAVDAPSPSCPPGSRRRRPWSAPWDSRKSPLTGLSIRSASSMKLGIRSRSVAQRPLELGIVADELQRGAEEADGGLLAGGEEIGGDPHDVDDVGRRRRRGTSRWRVPVITSSRGLRRRSSM